jgi:plasmid stability protein
MRPPYDREELSASMPSPIPHESAGSLQIFSPWIPVFGLAAACVAYAMVQAGMGVLLQIRDLPEDVHRTLKARAAASGTSLTEYVRSLLTRSAARPTPEELSERIRVRGTIKLKEPSEETVRHLRDHGE